MLVEAVGEVAHRAVFGRDLVVGERHQAPSGTIMWAAIMSSPVGHGLQLGGRDRAAAFGTLVAGQAVTGRPGPLSALRAVGAASVLADTVQRARCWRAGGSAWQCLAWWAGVLIAFHLVTNQQVGGHRTGQGVR